MDAALGRVDEVMEELVVQLKKRDIYDCVNLIIVSDHGNRLFWYCWLYVKIGSCTCTCIYTCVAWKLQTLCYTRVVPSLYAIVNVYNMCP